VVMASGGLRDHSLHQPGDGRSAGLRPPSRGGGAHPGTAAPRLAPERPGAGSP